MSPNVSVFANVSPSSFKGHFTTDDILKTIRSEKFKAPTEYLRSLKNAEVAKTYKAGKQDEQSRLVKPGHFYGVTWSGLFEGGKKANNLQAHSRLMCMDVDGLTTDQINALCKQLRTDEYTHILFVSPSGNGLKLIVKIDLQQPDEHKSFFRQLSDYLHDSYGLTRKGDVPKGEKPQIDPSGSDVSRLCFLPYAPDAYHNENSEIMPLLEEYKPTAQPLKAPEPLTEQPTLTVDHWPKEDDTHQRLTTCINELQRSGIDLTATYEDWVKIGLAFASLGEYGRTYYHDVSRLYPKYDYTETDAKFSELLRNRTGLVNIGTFFHLCEQAIGAIPKVTNSDHTNRSYTAYNGTQDNQRPTDAPLVNREWQNPQSIETSFLPVIPLNPDMIPEPLRPWLTDIAHRMKCPLDFVASAAIVMLSSLIGTRLTIQPKTRTDWTVVPNLWGAVIGGPSTMKTPSVSEVLKPLNRLVLAARAEFENSIAAYEREMIEYEAQKKAYASQVQDKHKGKTPVALMVNYPEVPKKPKERRYMVNDTTVEKLADLMNENPTGLLQMRDELTGLLAAWERPGHEQDRSFHLEAWNGSGFMTIDRIGRGTTHVNVICESLFGGIQPAKLLPYLQAATGYENDGFVQRLQVAVFPDPAPWEYTDEYPDKVARDRAFTVIQTIADADFSAIGYNADEFNKFPYTRFDTNAQEVFKQWLIKWETDVLPNESGLLLEHFTKYRSLMPSLALIFHVVNYADNPKPATGTEKHFVSTEAAQMAISWCDYLMSHARRIYGLLDSAGIESAKELLRHLKHGDLKDGFKVRDVYRKQWTNLKTTEQAETAVSELVTRHYLEEVSPPPTKGGRPEASHYFINPKIHPKA